MLDVYFFETFSEEKKLIEQFLPKDISAGYDCGSIQESKRKDPPAKIISIRTQSIIPKQWLPHFEAILSRTTGYDHLVNYGNHVRCGYLPLYCSRAVAEQAILLTLSLLRKLPQQIDQFHTFNRNNITGTQIKGKKVVVFGAGNIGSEIIMMTKGLGADVFAVDVVKKHPSINYITSEEGLKKADIIICAMDLNSSNVNFFDKKKLQKTKKGVILVNVSRGEITPIQDLIEMLGDKHIGAVGLDVYDKEPRLSMLLRASGPDHPLTKQIRALNSFPNVILTPHNAFNTKEATLNKVEQTIEQIISLKKYSKFKWETPKSLL